MIILRQSNFSSNCLIGRIIDKLDKDGINEYEVVDRIPSDYISISCDLGYPVIYLPREYEYSQYDIDDFIRSMVPYIRTNTTLDRNLYKMELSGKLSEVQIVKLIKHIIEINDYCVLIEH